MDGTTQTAEGIPGSCMIQASTGPQTTNSQGMAVESRAAF